MLGLSVFLPIVGYNPCKTLDESLDLSKRGLLLLPFERFPFRAINFNDELVDFLLRGREQFVIRMRWVRVFQQSLNQQLVTWDFLHGLYQQLVQAQLPFMLAFHCLRRYFCLDIAFSCLHYGPQITGVQFCEIYCS